MLMSNLQIPASVDEAKKQDKRLQHKQVDAQSSTERNATLSAAQQRQAASEDQRIDAAEPTRTTQQREAKLTAFGPSLSPRTIAQQTLAKPSAPAAGPKT
jgi:hypothetical protein